MRLKIDIRFLFSYDQHDAWPTLGSQRSTPDSSLLLLAKPRPEVECPFVLANFFSFWHRFSRQFYGNFVGDVEHEQNNSS